MTTRVARPGSRPIQREDPALSDTALTVDSATRLLLAAARLERRGELVAARELYDRVAELEELAVLALARRGTVERAMGALTEAASSLTRALHYCVDDPVRSHAIYVELGDVHAERGDYEEASYHYRRALVLDPGKVEVQRRLRGALHLSYCLPQTG
ncbi:MAG: tetratricopeptide repeat protein [Sandaracinaceae bacterium]|nr:tetratricopeptide repeat protein [Sandaracinaceae bacterium]